jgi:hypothetical protein
MKHMFSLFVVVALASPALADDAVVALDYRADDASCIDASRFADEVSAKLGFVPWNAAAPAKIKVRVEKDGGQFTGSVRNVDGTAKMIDGPTCAAVTSKLAITVAGAMDSTGGKLVAAETPPPAPPPATDDGKFAVTFASTEGRRIDVSLNTGGGTGVASNGTAVVTNFYEGLCTTPCSARLPKGRQYLTFKDPDSRSFGGDAFLIDGPTKIALTHKSRSGARRGWFIGGLVVTGVGVGGFAALGTSLGGILLGTTGVSIGIPMMMLPLFINDTFTATTSQ